MNDWNVVSNNIISNLFLSNPLYYIVLPQGDTMLDWGPDPEPGQGEHPYDPNNPDLVAPAMGNDFTEPGYHDKTHRHPRCLDDQRGGQARLLQSERVGPPPLGGAGRHGLQPNPRWVVRVHNSLLARWGTESHLSHKI